MRLKYLDDLVRLIVVLFLTSIMSVLANPVFAESTQKDQGKSEQISALEKQYYATLNAAFKVAKQGPTSISLLDQGKLDLSAEYQFVPKKEAADFMKASGNQTGSEFLGMILPKQKEMPWFITVDFIKSGYLRDDDAKKWSADDLLKTIKSGNDESNKERLANGFPQFEIEGWIESPAYDVNKHQLVWSLLGKDKDSTSESVVNYNTYVLGREGYFKLDLVTSHSTIDKDKIDAHTILNSLHYANGKRYEDFSEGRDQVAKYGLAALITGVAAHKLGLFALAGVFLVKIWKLIIVVPLLLWSFIKKIFKKN